VMMQMQDLAIAPSVKLPESASSAIASMGSFNSAPIDLLNLNFHRRVAQDDRC
jgi:hypothetical protein